MLFCNALLQCPSVVPPAVPLCSIPRRCPSAVPCRIFLLQCPSAVQRLESEKQVVLCQGEQQQQEYTLQMQCLQQACQDTLQRERAQNDEQVHLYFLHQIRCMRNIFFVVRATAAVLLKRKKCTQNLAGMMGVVLACLHLQVSLSLCCKTCVHQGQFD